MHVALAGLHDDGKYALSVRYAASTTAASTDAPAGCVDRGAVWLGSALDGDNRVVNSQRRVTHVDLALALERSRPNHRVLGDLVPLLNVFGRAGSTA